MSDPQQPFRKPLPQGPAPEPNPSPYAPPAGQPAAPPAWEPSVWDRPAFVQPTDPTLTQPVEPITPRPLPATAPPPTSTGRPAARRRPDRSRFWLGFALGFVLLSIGSCGSMALALGFGNLRLSDLRGRGESWTPPTLEPTPTIDPAAPPVAAADAAGGRFAVGQTVRNVTGSRVNVRSTPGHLGKETSDVLDQIAPGEAVIIQGESVAQDNLVWWRVSFQGVEGWVAEATASGVQILGQ